MNIELGDLKRSLGSVIGTIDEFKPIGNHQLKRHLVYKLTSGTEEYVVKIYYKKNRWNREIASLKLFEHTEVLAPRINRNLLPPGDSEY